MDDGFKEMRETVQGIVLEFSREVLLDEEEGPSTARGRHVGFS